MHSLYLQGQASWVCDLAASSTAEQANCMLGMQGDTETARRSLEDAINLKDKGRTNIAARLALANLLFVQGSYASALERQAKSACPYTCMHASSQRHGSHVVHIHSQVGAPPIQPCITALTDASAWTCAHHVM